MPENIPHSAPEVSLARKIGAVLALSLGVSLAGFCLQLVMRLGNLALFGNAGMLLNWKESIGLLCEIALFAGMLHHWRKSIDRGETPWFQTAGPLRFAFIILALLLLDTLIPFLVCLDPARLMNIPPEMLPDLQGLGTYRESHHLSPYWQILSLFKPMNPATLGSIIYHVLALAYTIFQCTAWFWWCDTPPRNRRALAMTAGAWALYSYLITTFQPAPMFPWDRATGRFFTHVDWNNHVSDCPGLFYEYLFLIAFAFILYSIVRIIATRRAEHRSEKPVDTATRMDGDTILTPGISVPPLRMFGAITTVYLAIESIKWVYLSLLCVLVSHGIGFSRITESVLAMGFMALSLLLPWAMLLFWRERMESGRRMWFSTLRTLYFLLIIGFLIFLLPLPALFRGQEDVLKHMMITMDGNNLNVLTPMIFQCLVWLWWSDRTPRRNRWMLYGALVWMGYNTVVTMLQHIDLIPIRFTGPDFVLSIAVYSALPAIASIGLYTLLRGIGIIRSKRAYPISS